MAVPPDPLRRKAQGAYASGAPLVSLCILCPCQGRDGGVGGGEERKGEGSKTGTEKKRVLEPIERSPAQD